MQKTKEVIPKTKNHKIDERQPLYPWIKDRVTTLICYQRPGSVKIGPVAEVFKLMSESEDKLLAREEDISYYPIKDWL